MPSERPKIRWTPKVRQAVIAELYHNVAKDCVDDDAIDKAGYALLARCLTLRMVKAGRVRCPLCGKVFVCNDPATPPEAVIRCPNSSCTWWTSRREYEESWKDGPICHSLAAVETFIEKHAEARNARETLLLIDELLHATDDTNAESARHPIATDLIEGTNDEVTTLVSARTTPPPTPPAPHRTTPPG